MFNRRDKVGAKSIDSKVTFKTNNIHVVSKLVDDHIIKQYLDIWNISSPVKIIMKKNFINIREFQDNDNTMIGIELYEWISVDMIKKLMPYASEISERIKRCL